MCIYVYNMSLPFCISVCFSLSLSLCIFVCMVSLSVNSDSTVQVIVPKRLLLTPPLNT